MQTKTFERYLIENLRAGNTDHSLRAFCYEGNGVRFYLHPTNANGETPEFVTAGALLMAMPTAGHKDMKEMRLDAASEALSGVADLLDRVIRAGGLDSETARKLSIAKTNAEQAQLWLGTV